MEVNLEIITRLHRYLRPKYFLQIIFRLYDEDGNNVITKKEIDQISQIITQPDFAARFEGGVINIVREVENVDPEKYVSRLKFNVQ